MAADSAVMREDDPTGRRSPRRPKYQLWPTIKKVMPSTGKGTPDLGVYFEWNSSQSSIGTTASKASGTTPSKAQNHPECAPLGRRQGHPENVIAPMTTVQEYYMDSPTIPGRFPIMHERSQSAPSESATRVTFENVLRRPIGGPLVVKPDTNIRSDNPSVQSTQIADNTPSDADADTSSHSPEIDDERPPAVPPKSPRMLGAAARALRQPASKSNQPIPRVPNKATLGRSEAIVLQPLRCPNSTTNPPHPELSTKTTSSAEGNRCPLSIRPAELTTGSHPHKRSESASAVPNTSRRAFNRDIQDKITDPQERAHTPIMERGRPTKRNKTFAGRLLKAAFPGGYSSVAQPPGFEVLPTGPTPSDALTIFSAAEIELLQAQAKSQACMFQILKHGDVKIHARELKVLDERCDYLRNTYNHLRAGRRNLHERMMGFLRGSTSVTFCKDTILKQEEALAELDLSIDEWAIKLEYAENRRIRVRQKLLEHFAAVLMLQTMANEHQSRGETPPPSPPDGKDSNELIESCLESIRIYADSKVRADAKAAQDLIAEIEEEMEAIKSRPGTS